MLVFMTDQIGEESAFNDFSQVESSGWGPYIGNDREFPPGLLSVLKTEGWSQGDFRKYSNSVSADGGAGQS